MGFSLNQFVLTAIAGSNFTGPVRSPCARGVANRSHDEVVRARFAWADTSLVSASARASLFWQFACRFHSRSPTMTMAS